MLDKHTSATLDTDVLSVVTKPSHDKRNELITLFLIWSVVLFGAAKRITMFIDNKSLWNDEAGLADNVWMRSFSELTQALDYFKASPLLFLWTAKINSLLFGTGEMAWRLEPLVLGLAALFVFTLLARKLLNRWQSVVAVSLFALNGLLTQYSVEFKHFAADVLFLLMTVLCFVQYEESKTRKWAILLAATGAISLWFSFSMAFTVLSTAFTLLVLSTVRKHFTARHTVPIVVAWVASYTALFFCQLSNLLAHKQQMALYPHIAYVPTDLQQFVLWLPETLDRFARQNLQLSWPWLVIMLIGVIVGARKKPALTFIFLFPLLPISFLSAQHLFPCVSRYLLFFVPSAIIFMCWALDIIKPSFIRWGLAAALVVSSIATAARPCFNFCQLAEAREIVTYVKNHWVPGDVLANAKGCHSEMIYYTHRLDFSGTYPGYADWQGPRKFDADPQQPIVVPRRAARFWFVSTCAPSGNGQDKKHYDALVARMKNTFRLLDQKTLVKAEAFLFDQTLPPVQSAANTAAAPGPALQTDGASRTETAGPHLNGTESGTEAEPNLD